MIGRFRRRIRRYFSCISETRSGRNNDNVVHVREVPEQELREPPILVRIERRLRRKKKTSILGILKINIDNIENIDVNTNVEDMLELKEMGVYTKDDVNILCSICLEEIDYMNDIRFIQPCCGQVYHLDCIGKWVKENQTCPICKHPLFVFR